MRIDLKIVTLVVASYTCLTHFALGATLTVGPGGAYAAPCQAIAAAADGDTIEIDAAGAYDGDVCAIAPSGLTLRGVHGRAHIDAAGRNYGGKAIWVIQGNDTVIEGIELSGATVPDQNGAGIRQEGTNLTVRNCFFHDNENGILTNADPNSEILVESSEFARNGYGDGYSHNMYIGNIQRFTLRYSYSHSAKVGHLVKSRAEENFILYNRLTGEADGTQSYEINLPNAGTSYVIGNLVEQGSTTENSAMLDYGSEGPTNPGNDLYVINNTFVNERSGGAVFVSINAAVGVPAVVKNNVFLGNGTPVSQGNAVQANNYAGGDPMLLDPTSFDYHLGPGSPCVDTGVDPGSAGGVSLVPVAQYVHPASFEGRSTVGTIDIGAYELNGAAGAPGSGGQATLGGGTGGVTPVGGGGSAGAPSGPEQGCDCRMAPRRHPLGIGAWLVLALAALGRRGCASERPGRHRSSVQPEFKQ
jgi:MYXO-CTERM domain-containing protein